MPHNQYREEITATFTFLQNIIARMATMSTICKICCITGFSGLYAAWLAQHNAGFLVFALLYIMACCGVDCFYLYKERNYIAYFNSLAHKWRMNDFSQKDIFRLSIRSSKRQPGNKKGCPLKSYSIWPFYGALALVDLASLF